MKNSARLKHLPMSANDFFEKKWAVFQKRVKLFRHIPFVEFVLLAGSMATGKVRAQSDFDVMIGAREGRVWTTWFLCTLALQLRGWREHPGVDQTNRISLSHFASPKGYRFSEPHNAYWEDLYKKLIPVMGSEERFAQFFTANDWLGPPRTYVQHEKYLGDKRSWHARCWESVLGGKLGDRVEKFLKKRLVGRLRDSKKIGYKPKMVWDDDRLEIYRDTKRIEEMIGWGKL